MFLFVSKPEKSVAKTIAALLQTNYHTVRQGSEGYLGLRSLVAFAPIGQFEIQHCCCSLGVYVQAVVQIQTGR